VSVTIRAGVADTDAQACATIYAPHVSEGDASFELEPPSAGEMARRMRDYGSSHAWLVAEKDDSVIGYAYGSPHRTRAAYASSCDVAVYVAPQAAGQGVGRALYDELLPILAQRYHAAFAGIALPNDASVRLHEAVGFTPVGIYREVGRKHGVWRDVGWWQRLL